MDDKEKETNIPEVKETKVETPVVKPEVNNVLEKKEETPNRDTTLGTIEVDNNKSMIPVIIIFVVIIGACFGLPYIYDYVSPYFEKKVPTYDDTPVNPVNPNPSEPTDPDKELSLPVDLNGDTNLVMDSLSINNISLISNDNSYYINYTLNNNSEEIYDNDKALYLELYNSENTFLGRAIIDNNTPIMGNKNITLRSEISSVVYSSASKINVVTKTELEYPSITLVNNKLTCTKGSRVIEYTFLEDKLTNINDVYTYITIDPSRYDSDYMRERNRVNNFMAYNGVPSYEETETGFIVRLNLPLSDENKNVEGLDSVYYAKDTSPEKVSFDAEAKAYICE